MSRHTWIAASSALALGACASSSMVQLTTTQALAIGEAGVNGANQSATAAAQNGLLKGKTASDVKTGLDTANTALTAAYGAWQAGNNALASAQAAIALKNIATVQAAVAPPGTSITGSPTGP